MVDTRDGILGFVVGDALGVPVEFKSRESLILNPVVDMRSFGTHEQEEGTWSDDTSLLLATMDSITSLRKINYDDIASNFTDFLNYSKYTANDEVFDVGRTCLRAIVRFQEQKKNATECGENSEYSNGNGSLMRILPAVYYLRNKKDKELRETIIKLSSITHGHEISCLGCYLYTKYIQFLLQGKDKNLSFKLLRELTYDSFSIESVKKYDRIFNGSILTEDVKSSGYVVDTLEAVLYSILMTNNYKDAVLKAVNLGEDTDTVGALTGSIAGIIYGYESIPKEWLDVVKKKCEIEEMANAFTLTINKKI